jgi:hypothetical protein
MMTRREHLVVLPAVAPIAAYGALFPCVLITHGPRRAAEYVVAGAFVIFEHVACRFRPRPYPRRNKGVAK